MAYAGFTVDFVDTSANPFGGGPHHFDNPPWTYKVKANGDLLLKENGVVYAHFGAAAWNAPVVED